MPGSDPKTLGTLLRTLLELLDGDLQRAYASAGLEFRPRFTPIVRSVMALGEPSIRQIASHAGMTHSAVSQTVAQMTRAGLLKYSKGADGRERIVSPTDKLTAILPALQAQWASTNFAAAELEASISTPLSKPLDEAIAALEKKSFARRIEEASRKTRSDRPDGTANGGSSCAPRSPIGRS